MKASRVQRILFLVGAVLTAGGCGSGADPAAEKMLLQNVGKTSVTVFPAVVRRQTVSYDDNASVKLTEFLNTAGLADATASDRHVPITGPWRHNPARMLRESAKEFAAYVRANPIGTRYALLPEYLFGPTEAGGIHAYVVDADGTVAFQVLLNSHWEEFSKAKPKTADDCTAVLIDVLRDRLKRPAARQ